MTAPLSLPRVIGHRGAKRYAPENTIAGLVTAARQGARMVEVDVKLTRDRVPILMHDDTLDRTTDGTGPVAEWDFAEIAPLDAGSHLHEDFAGERVPTLAAALEVCRRLDLAINLELKPNPGEAETTALVALTLARTLWPDAAPPPLLSSFDPACLEAAKTVAADWPRGMLFWDRPADWEDIARAVGATTVNLNGERETPADVADIAQAGWPVLIYTINDPAPAQAFIDAGARSIVTDVPKKLIPVLGV